MVDEIKRKRTRAKKRCVNCGKTEDDGVKLLFNPEIGDYLCEDCNFNFLLQNNFLEKMLNAGIDIGAVQTKTTKQTRKADVKPNIEPVNLMAEMAKLPKPSEITAFLDQYVIGQTEAKKILSVAVYNHYKRILSIDSSADDDVELPKNNVLMLGPTGSGKTLLAQTLAKYLDVPFAIADATTLTEAGYVGDDVENILLRLFQAADSDITRTERGIIYIDEIDKVARKSESVSITRDVSGEGVQQALLKIIEGTVAGVPPTGGRKHPNQELIYINTKDILFICGGAFDGIEKIIAQRTNEKQLGFGGNINADMLKNSPDELLKKVTPDDLRKFGFIPEIIGRLPVIVSLDAMSEDVLKRIFKEPRNAPEKQYKKLFSFENVELYFTDGAVDEIAKKAAKMKTGARGLRNVIEGFMLNLQYEIPSNADKIKSVTITKETVDGTGQPLIENRE